MSLSRVVIAFFALSPFAFGASKEIMELQRDVAMLQDQVRTLQSALDQKVGSLLTLAQQTADSVNRTNTAVAIMQSSFNDTMKQQQQNLSAPVASVATKLDQMSDDFRAVRESVLDMNTRMGKLDAKIADLETLINTVRAPAAPPPATTPPVNGAVPPPADSNASLSPGLVPTGPASGPPQGVQAGALYTNAYGDYMAGKYDIASQEFSDYLKYYSGTDLAPNAQYYIANTYYRKADYNNALTAFDAVLEKFSDNPKTPDARYMKAMCLVKLGRNDSAAREFRDVYMRYSSDHPDIAAKAKAQLHDMGLTVGVPVKRRKPAN
jgi:tol-pal system protein YbgF